MYEYISFRFNNIPHFIKVLGYYSGHVAGVLVWLQPQEACQTPLYWPCLGQGPWSCEAPAAQSTTCGIVRSTVWSSEPKVVL